MVLNSAKVRKAYHVDKMGLTPHQHGFAKGLANVVSGTIKPYKKYR
jgi:hypothetical protein